MDFGNNYNQIFARRTKALTITIINELSEIPYSDKNLKYKKTDIPLCFINSK